MSSSIVSAFFATILLLLGASSAAHGGCGDKHENRDIRDRSWAKSNEIIYFSEGGKILEMPVNSDKAEQLSVHEGEFIQSLMLSSDGNYIAYTTSVPHKDDGYYIYDLKNRVDHKASATGSRDPRNIQFSPDSAWAVQVDIGLGSDPKQIILFDLKSNPIKEYVAAYPVDVTTLHDYRMTHAKWSLDSKSIYLVSVAYPTGAFFSYDITDRQFRKMDGYYDFSGRDIDSKQYGPHFVVEGKEVPFYKPPCMQWQCGGQGKPEENVTAFIDKNYNLIVKNSDGHEEKVDSGEYNQCEGPTIRILSWLENGKYLVYSARHIVYVYGVEERRKSILFGSDITYFGWHAIHNRAEYPF